MPGFNKLTKSLPFSENSDQAASSAPLVGVLEGEGIGPDVVPIALELLRTLSEGLCRPIEICYGGDIGVPAKEKTGKSLTDEVITFVESVFSRGGVLFCGAGGERFVYDLRRRFELFCKFTPLCPFPELNENRIFTNRDLSTINIIAVRDNAEGIYQGCWDEQITHQGERSASQSFSYTEPAVDRILQTAIALAESRSRKLTVVLKPGGVPSISQLWEDRALALTRERRIELSVLEIDNAVYQLIAAPEQFDVMVSPNLFGDVLADAGALLLGSRGMSYSGNFSLDGHAVYQTGHGAAKDLANTDKANPLGQILAMEMLIRESLGWVDAADLLIRAVREILAQGYRTADIALPKHTLVGTSEMGDLIKQHLQQLLASYCS